MTFMTEVCQNETQTQVQQTTTATTTSTSHTQTGSNTNVTSPNVKESTNNTNAKAKSVASSMRSFDISSAYSLALCQALSTFCGYLFPHITSLPLWIFTMIISCLLFLVLYYRLYKRYKSFQFMTMGSSIGEQEMYHWSRLSLGLLATCTALWTFLVFTYFVYSFGPVILTQHKFLAARGFVMVCECSIDVLFKSIYMLLIVDIHNGIFDPNHRAQRRLEELREMMNVVWENSSDVIGLSLQKPTGDVMTILSPTFLKLVSGGDDNIHHIHEHENEQSSSSSVKTKQSQKGSKGAAFYLDAKYFKYKDSFGKNANDNNNKSISKIAPSLVYEVDFGRHFNSQDLRKECNTPPIIEDNNEYLKEVLQPISELVVKAWHANKETNMVLHDLVRKKDDDQNETIRCEANINRIDENAIVVVVRNVSERYHRFEAEKKVVQETTARIKDEAANRFTRHEVKNGLLAAIGLSDSLKESVFKEGKDVQVDVNNNNCSQRIILELDKTLREILDIVLAEAMARDVIHEVYKPKQESVDVARLIQNIMTGAQSADTVYRFPIVTEPSPLPHMALDPQLVRYIYRNAMSNACKYGKIGGVVMTEIKWDEQKGVLHMNVINLPGENHEEILKLGILATDMIFSPSKRLQIHDVHEKEISTHSSGDGAWVMLQCAKTLGGNCSIEVRLYYLNNAFFFPFFPFMMSYISYFCSFEWIVLEGKNCVLI